MAMNYISSLIVPIVIILTATVALHKKQDVFGALTAGAKDGLSVIVKILPSLVVLVTAVHILRASGLTDAIAHAIAPALNFIGIPPETTALVLIRPFSGSGALAVGSEIIQQYGADSLIGRTAAVMLGSTETTFYTIAVYFGAVGVRKTRYAIPAALIADLVGFLAASLTVRIFWG